MSALSNATMPIESDPSTPFSGLPAPPSQDPLPYPTGPCPPTSEGLAGTSPHALFGRLLREPSSVTREILERNTAHELIPSLVTITAGSAAVFGLSVGLQGGLPQAIASGVKIPITLLAAAGLSLPLLHLATALGGRRLRLEQLSAVVLQSLATATIVMACLAPLIAICWLTLAAGHAHGEFGDACDWCWWVYRRVTLASFGIATIGGIAGAVRMLRTLSPISALIWTGSFALAGIQLAWLLRPIVGSPTGEWVLFRSLESSGLHEILVALLAVLP